MIAYRRGDRAIFLLGFAKSERDDVDGVELAELKGIGQLFLELNEARIEVLTRSGEMLEVKYDWTRRNEGRTAR